jgi:hypothetical protein
MNLHETPVNFKRCDVETYRAGPEFGGKKTACNDEDGARAFGNAGPQTVDF